MSRRAAVLRRAVERVSIGGDDVDLDDQRRAMDGIDRLPRPRGMHYADMVVGGVRAIRAVPSQGSADRHILYVHGGGYIVGSPKSHIAMAARLARRCQATVTVIDYRLAPEHPYPAAIEDCVAAYHALCSETAPATIALVGDSAGGGATLATLVQLVAAEVALPGCAYVISPWTDLTASGHSVQAKADVDPMIAPDRITEVARMYAGGLPLDDPRISPLFADLGGLPPLLIQVGTDEVLLSDSTRLAERAHQAGVDVTLDVAEGMWHVYQALARFLPEADRAFDRAAAFIGTHTDATGEAGGRHGRG